ncbi:uncharacterized protein V1518DRAFT_413827 [Limtongia smithiae]|uniref:uncharacterized protein n=1 Tax=Limtongia smithiae TaxID=1125753 RepID=UPI0034CF84B5
MIRCMRHGFAPAAARVCALRVALHEWGACARSPLSARVYNYPGFPGPIPALLQSHLVPFTPPLLRFTMVNYHLGFTAATACIGGVLFGYDTGFIGAAVSMSSFQRDFGITTANKAQVSANVVAILQAGCFFGTLIMAVFTNKFGRRGGMALASFVFVIGAIVQTATTGSLGMLYAGRAISGLGVGAASMLTPTYLSEISPREVRGRLGTAYGCSIFTAIMVSYWVDYGCNEHLDHNTHMPWRVPMGLQLVPGVLYFVGAIFIKESPRWLIKVGQREKGFQSLCYIRMASPEDPVVRQEYDDICRSTEEELLISEGVSIKEMFSKEYRIRVLIGFLLMFCQQFSGTNALTYYAPTLFETVGLSGTSASLFATGVYGIVKTCASLFFMFVLAKRVGRRLPFFIGSCSMATCFIIVGVVLVCKPPPADVTSPPPASIAMMVFIYLFCVSYSCSWGPVPFTYLSEIYPNRIREYCVAMGLATQWAFNYVISRIVPVAIANIGWRTFLMFGIFNIGIAVFSFFVLRETEGVSLEHMDEVFQTGFLMKPSQWHLSRPAVIKTEIPDYELDRQVSTKGNNEYVEHVTTDLESESSKASTHH